MSNSKMDDFILELKKIKQTTPATITSLLTNKSKE